jgi:hypothetical protein
MLKEGATTFWEKYNPQETGVQHLAMYQKPYLQSLCHAWGASPLYLLGKYFLGVKPTGPGYRQFEIRPEQGDLKWMNGRVPTPMGYIDVYMDTKQIQVTATQGNGYLYIRSRKPRSADGQLEKVEEGLYRLPIIGNGKAYRVYR